MIANMMNPFVTVIVIKSASSFLLPLLYFGCSVSIVSFCFIFFFIYRPTLPYLELKPKELMPTKMSPNRVFDKAVGKVTEHPEVIRRFGAQLKAYGRDHGGHREGRRNFIE